MTWLMGGMCSQKAHSTSQEHGQCAGGHTALRAAERIQQKPHGAQHKQLKSSSAGVESSRGQQEGRQREKGVVWPKTLGETLIAASKYLTGGYRKDTARLFSKLLGNRRQEGKKDKQQHGKLWLGVRQGKKSACKN